MTNAQQSYWDEFVQHPDQPLSTVAHCIEITGRVNIDKLTQAINQTLFEAQVLRLNFSHSGDPSHPKQKISFDENVSLDLVDLTGVEEGLRHASNVCF